MAIRLALTGDLMFGDHPVCLGHGVRSRTERYGVAHLLEHAKPILLGADLSIGNLECVLSDSSEQKSELQRLEMRGRPAVAGFLREAGFDIVSVANNHILQHGNRAFRETVDRLKEAGVDVVGLNDGSGRSNVLERKINGQTLAVIAYSMRPERYAKETELAYARAEASAIVEHVRELRGRYGTLIACIHWGEEYITDPSPEQIRLGRTLADEGVTLLVGHHPHVLQGYELRQGSGILYSLGNFIFDKWRRFERETAIAEVALSEGRVESLQLTPFFIGRDYVPRRVTGIEAERQLNTINKLNQRLDVCASEPTDGYTRRANQAYLRYRLASYTYFLRNVYRYPPRVIMASFARSVRRRLRLA